MQLLMIIVNDEFQEEMSELLNENGYVATMVASTGQFLQYGNTTFILGVENNETENLMTLIETKTKSKTQNNEDSGITISLDSTRIKKGFASIFIMNVENYVQTK